ncbi:hypothetical protein LEP1GSC038_3728 [Leptospira weilii str. 2006001855]|uniref:Uncharacterized protein n=1 Tax=Leptospira weilii str. 2006001855 TaxID=996804 RepID=M6FZB7_9LEPT|nr:hypothetical protein LEP1GSC038_3728 [Leptospira weilii str. 2006001855]
MKKYYNQFVSKFRMLDLLQKKRAILDSAQFCERFYFFAKTVC